MKNLKIAALTFILFVSSLTTFSQINIPTGGNGNTTNNNVGIGVGIATPWTPLDIQSNLDPSPNPAPFTSMGWAYGLRILPFNDAGTQRGGSIIFDRGVNGQPNFFIAAPAINPQGDVATGFSLNLNSTTLPTYTQFIYGANRPLGPLGSHHFTQNVLVNGNLGVGPLTVAPVDRVEINSGFNCNSGLTLSRLPNTCNSAPAGSGNGRVLSVDGTGKVILIDANPNSLCTSNPDQSCFWSVNGNSASTVNGNSILGTVDNIPLRIATSNIERIHVNENIGATSGFVGIRTISPQQALHVDNASVLISQPLLGNDGLHFKNQANINGNYISDWSMQYCEVTPGNKGLNFWKPFGNPSGNFGNNFLFLHDNGNVGIQTEAPTRRLDVNGDARIRNLLPNAPHDFLVTAEQDGTLHKIGLNTQQPTDYLGNDGNWHTFSANVFSNNCITKDFIPKVINTNGDLKCSQIFDNGSEVGVGTTNLVGIAETGAMKLKTLGQSFVTLDDAQHFHSYNGNEYSLIVGCQSIPGNDLITRGLAFASPFGSPRFGGVATDQLCIYIDDNSVNRLTSLGNFSVWRDKIYKQDMWGIDPARGVVMAPDFVTARQGGRIYEAKLFVESNSSNATECKYDQFGNGFTAAAIVNNQNDLWVAFQKVGLYAESSGQVGNFTTPLTSNMAGIFFARNERTNYGIRVLADRQSPDIRTEVNYGGWFRAANASIWNYAVYAETPPGNCADGTGHVNCPQAAGYFAGDVFTTSAYYSPSDSKLKKNITKLTDASSLIKNLNTYSYEFNPKQSALSMPTGIQYGFLAEEVQKVLPFITKQAHQPAVIDSLGKVTEEGFDYTAINYSAFIPLLVKGWQEQQEQLEAKDSAVEALKNEMQAMKDKLNQFETALSECCTNFESKTQSSELNYDRAWLEQNVPNPFNQNTVIKYYIPKSTGSASINIYSLDGAKLNMFNISQKGTGQIEISGSTLAPGTYVYYMVIDGKQVEGKLMTLTK